MANIITVKGQTPIIPKSAWVADNATITGDVSLGENASVWFQTVIRGDVNKIIIGNQTNIQDACMVHGSTGGIDTYIGHRVSIGHGAIIHGCTIQDDVLIGMGAIILDEVVIEPHVIVAAGAVVTGGKILESGYIYAGTPARKLKLLSSKMINDYILENAVRYVENKEMYRK